jgi:dimethylsulfone monooxygenase
MVDATRVRPIRFGVWTPLPHTIRPEPRMTEAIASLRSGGAVGQADMSFEFACEAVKFAEASGFAVTLVAARFLGPDLEAFTLGSALATRTSSIEILIAAHPGIIPPQVVAKMAMSIDRLSGGRCALNIVNGWFDKEFRLFSNGASLDGDGNRYLRMREYIDVIRGLTSGKVALEGKFYTAQLDNMPMRPARPIPFYAASRAPEGKDIIAETCDVWFVDYVPEYSEYANNVERIRLGVSDLVARAKRAGRSVECGISCHVIYGANQAAAEEAAHRLVAQPDADKVSLIATKALGAGLVGPPAVIADRIRALHEAGVSCFMLHFHPMLEGLKRFVDEVIPLLRDQAPIELVDRTGRMQLGK